MQDAYRAADFARWVLKAAQKDTPHMMAKFYAGCCHETGRRYSKDSKLSMGQGVPLRGDGLQDPSCIPFQPSLALRAIRQITCEVRICLELSVFTFCIGW